MYLTFQNAQDAEVQGSSAGEPVVHWPDRPRESVAVEGVRAARLRRTGGEHAVQADAWRQNCALEREANRRSAVDWAAMQRQQPKLRVKNSRWLVKTYKNGKVRL